MPNSKLKTIRLNSGYEVAEIGLGCYDIPRSLTRKIVFEACKVGYRHFDTAVLYGNEHEVGQGIQDWLESSEENKRSDVWYTTKLWNSECGYKQAKAAIKRCLEKVADLQYIDLLLIHSPLCGPVERLNTWRACQEAVDEGLVKSIGVSNYGKHHIEQLLLWDGLKYPPAVNQIEISPWCMREDLAQWCLQQNIQVEAYAPLTHGYKLSHPPNDFTPILDKYGIDMAQLLIKWSRQKGYIPLPKTKTPARLKSNIAMAFELTAEEMSIVDQPGAYEPTDWECTDAP